MDYVYHPAAVARLAHLNVGLVLLLIEKGAEAGEARSLAAEVMAALHRLALDHCEAWGVVGLITEESIARAGADLHVEIENSGIVLIIDFDAEAFRG